MLTVLMYMVSDCRSLFMDSDYRPMRVHHDGVGLMCMLIMIPTAPGPAGPAGAGMT